MGENLKQKMDLILTVGQILVESGATTDRVIRNSKRVAAYMKIPAENFQMQVMPASLFLNIFDGETTHTAFRNCKKHGLDMNIVSLVSNFTWKLSEKNYSPEEFRDILRSIVAQERIYSPAKTVMAAGVACGALGFLFGGDIFAAIYTAICAMLGKFLQLKLLKIGVNEFLAITSAAFLATVAAYFAHFLPTEYEWCPVVACALFLVPGVPIVNSAIDMLNNFSFNGLNSAFRAILVAISMAAGIVFAVDFCIKVNPTDFIGVRLMDFTTLSLVPDHNFLAIIIAAAVASVGFSVIFDIPKKIFIPVAIFGAVSVCTRNFLMFEMGFSQEVGTILGAGFVSILTIKARELTHTPKF